MRKTTLVIDDQLLDRARKVLGTRGMKQTIDRALEEVVAWEARRALIRRLESHDGLDLLDPAVTAQAWRD